MLGVSGTPVLDVVESSGISEIAWATNVRFLILTHGLMIRLAEQPVGCVYYTL